MVFGCSSKAKFMPLTPKIKDRWGDSILVEWKRKSGPHAECWHQFKKEKSEKWELMVASDVHLKISSTSPYCLSSTTLSKIFRKSKEIPSWSFNDQNLLNVGCLPENEKVLDLKQDLVRLKVFDNPKQMNSKTVS